MTPEFLQILLTLCTLAIAVVALLASRAGPDLVLMGCLGVLMIAGVVGVPEALKGFGNEGLITVAVLFVVAEGLQQTGAANLIAESVLSVAGSLGPWGIVVGLYLVTAAATMVIPTAALVVLMAPIVLKASADMGISPQASMMAMAIAASASFTSPISHPANLLVMGPGGYAFKDYVRIGVPLTILVLIVTLLVLPWVWPL